MAEAMEPNEALGIAAQVAVTLAGFAGIVVVFLPESVHQWSRVDRFRLRLLLSNSIFPLAYSLFGMLLLTIKPAPDSIWQWCSAFAAVFQVPFAIANFRTPRYFSPDESKGMPKILFYPLAAIGIATLLLQNCAILRHAVRKLNNRITSVSNGMQSSETMRNSLGLN